MGAISRLPNDLVRLIFSFIILRPRLLVVSRVCKHWRFNVLHSVDCLRDPMDLRQAPMLCSSLRELHLTSFPGALTIAPHLLLSLDIRQPVQEERPLPDSALLAYTALTRLRCFHSAFLELPVIRIAHTSLTELKVTVDNATSEVFYEIAFPYLRSLAINYTAPEEGAPLVRFVVGHASQLVSLTLETDCDLSELSQNCRMPQLRHLRLGGIWQTSNVLEILSHCSESLRLSYCNARAFSFPTAPTQNLLMHSLSELILVTDERPSMWISSCTRLTSIAVHLSSLDMVRDLGQSPKADYVTSVLLGQCSLALALRAIVLCTRIVSLRLSYLERAPEDPFKPPRLPFLRKLRWVLYTDDDESLRLLTQFLDFAPVLRKLTLSIPKTDFNDWYNFYMNVVPKKAGLEIVGVRTPRENCFPWVRFKYV